MTGKDVPRRNGPPVEDAATAAGGTPFPVDVSSQPGFRTAAALLLAGPVLSSVHFLLVYLTVEAGCSTEGSGFEVFDPPTPTAVTLVATAIAALACLATAGLAYRRWRTSTPQDARGSAGGELPDYRPLAFVGLLLSLLGLTTVLLVGLPALLLPACAA